MAVSSENVSICEVDEDGKLKVRDYISERALTSIWPIANCRVHKLWHCYIYKYIRASTKDPFDDWVPVLFRFTRRLY